MSSRGRIAGILLAALGFGLVAAVVKGTGGGEGLPELRSALGNLSTPWLLVAFVAGTRASSLRSGALLGLAATSVALFGFYLLGSLMQDLGPQGFVADLRLELSANRAYIEAGLVSGPLFGALGAWWQQSRRLRASIIAGMLLMAEPIVLLLLGAFGPDQVWFSGTGVPTAVHLLPGWKLSADDSDIRLAVYAAEFAVGLGLILAATTSQPWSSASLRSRKRRSASE